MLPSDEMASMEAAFTSRILVDWKESQTPGRRTPNASIQVSADPLVAPLAQHAFAIVPLRGRSRWFVEHYISVAADSVNAHFMAFGPR